MNNEIIVVKQLPIIQEQLQQIKTEVTEKVETALKLVCTEETVKSVKEVRAALNKELKGWEDKRKEVKAAIMKPYDDFDAVYKDCVSNVYKKADTELKAKIDEVENELKKQKTEEVAGYFYEYLSSNIADGAKWIIFENAKINVTLSASLKSLKEQAKAFIDRICDDLNLIETQEHKDEILYEYKQDLNVSAAITTVVNRYKAIEEEKARAEERRAREEAAKEAAKKVEEFAPPIIEPVAPPIEEEPILTLKFTVRGTRTKLRELKEYLERNGFDYE